MYQVRILRKAMAFVKERFGNANILGAEVGVQQGYHTLDILTNMPNVKLLYLVDPYLENTIWAPYKSTSKQLLAPFNDRIHWIYKEFEVCTVKDIPDPLDFIYIDGDHAYEHVKQDIALAAQLVKKGGVIGGHDRGAEGVDKAVIEYCARKNITHYCEGNLPYVGWDWWFINI